MPAEGVFKRRKRRETSAHHGEDVGGAEGPGARCSRQWSPAAFKELFGLALGKNLTPKQRFSRLASRVCRGGRPGWTGAALDEDDSEVAGGISPGCTVSPSWGSSEGAGRDDIKAGGVELGGQSPGRGWRRGHRGRGGPRARLGRYARGSQAAGG